MLTNIYRETDSETDLTRMFEEQAHKVNDMA